MSGERAPEGRGLDAAARSGSAILAHERRREITNNMILVALFVVCSATAAYCSSAGDEGVRSPLQE